jgi:trk system potassium uptake protein TrkA
MKRFAVIGLGHFGKRLATHLAQAGAEVIAVDRDLDIVESLRDRVALAVCLDSIDEDALRAQGIDKVDVAVVGIGESFEDNALITVILKKRLKIPRVISRATTKIRADILSHIGADEVVNPEQEAADRWCNYLMAPAVIERITLATDHSLVQLAAPEDFYDRTLKELAVRTKYNVNVVAIRRTVEQRDEDTGLLTRRDDVLVAMPDSVIQPNDVLFLIGRDEDITSFPTR